MPLPASPPISFSQVRTEFTSIGTNANMSAYRRGGGIVPDTSTNASISTTSAGLALSQFYNASYVSVINHTVSKSGDASGGDSTAVSSGSVAVTTNSVTATPANGVGPFTYSWVYVSGSTFTVNSSTSATTTFSKTAAAPSVDGTCNSFSGTYRCNVTDTGNGSYVAYVDVTVSTEHCYYFA